MAFQTKEKRVPTVDLETSDTYTENSTTKVLTAKVGYELNQKIEALSGSLTHQGDMDPTKGKPKRPNGSDAQVGDVFISTGSATSVDLAGKTFDINSGDWVTRISDDGANEMWSVIKNQPVLKLTDSLTNDSTTTALSAKGGKDLQDNKAEKSNVIEKNNTTPFTPTENHHPVTVLYTATQIKTLADNVLQLDNTTPFTPVGDHHPTTVAFVRTSVKALEDNVLTRDNTDDFTPTADFHPSTKAYTDTTVKTLQDNVLTRDNTTDYTPTEDYHPATKVFVDTLEKQVLKKNNTQAFTPTGDHHPVTKIFAENLVTTLAGNVLTRDNTDDYTPTSDHHPTTKVFVEGEVTKLEKNVLTKDNSTDYTPTQDHHPATKKFVEDGVTTFEKKLNRRSILTTTNNGSGGATHSISQGGVYEVDTTNGQVTITVPANFPQEDFYVRDLLGKFTTNNCIVDFSLFNKGKGTLQHNGDNLHFFRISNVWYFRNLITGQGGTV